MFCFSTLSLQPWVCSDRSQFGFHQAEPDATKLRMSRQKGEQQRPAAFSKIISQRKYMRTHAAQSHLEVARHMDDRPSSQCRATTHIDCQSRIDSEKVPAHPHNPVHNQNSREPKHTSCTRACRHNGLCQRCGVYKSLKAFRRTKGSRIDVCRQCEVMQCIACTATFPQTCFTSIEISNHFTKGTPVVCPQCKNHGCTARCPHPVFHRCSGPCQKILDRTAFTGKAWTIKNTGRSSCIVCNSCRKDEAANLQKRLQHLRQLLKTSKRKRCICRAIEPQEHEKRCPMHIAFPNDIRYPGCDVMTAEDSAWLRKRDGRYRLRRLGGKHVNLEAEAKREKRYRLSRDPRHANRHLILAAEAK